MTDKEQVMGHKVVKRLPTLKVQAHLERIVHEVATIGASAILSRKSAQA